MSQENEKPDSQSAEKEVGKWWCNFCEFRSDNEADYLAHSCKEVLAEREAAKKKSA